MATKRKTPTISVLGGGSWGTTVAHLIASNGHDVVLWCRRKEQADEINKKHVNSRYLPDLKLSKGLRATHDFDRAVRDVPLIFHIIPSKSFREVSKKMGDIIQPDQFIIHGTKGIEPGTWKRMSQILTEETCCQQFGVLAGPNIAREICENKPAGTVIASRFPRVIEAGQKALVSQVMRVYSNDDVVGVEWAGALKNIVAIASGLVSGLGLGENTRSLLITRGLSEIARLGARLGADPMTFMGVAGVGDLIVTCMSKHSRNHRVGAALATGMSLPEAIESLGMVAEGVNTAKVAADIIDQHKIDAPLLSGIHAVLDGQMSVQEALKYFMSLESRHDIDQSLR